MSEHIVVERRQGVQIIRLNRPEKKNAINRAMYAAMTAALYGGDEDDDIRCHVLLGGPGVFSAGNDIADFLAAADEAGAEALDFLLALARCEKPIVSGVDGIAVGIGTTLHFHCDLTFVTSQTVFHTPFVDLGLVPEAGSSLLAPRVLGPQRAFALLALGEELSAEEAWDAGFIYRIVPASDLESAVLATAAKLAAKPPEALELTRDLMRSSRREVMARICKEAEYFQSRLQSPEARAAFAAFMERRRENA